MAFCCRNYLAAALATRDGSLWRPRWRLDETCFLFPMKTPHSFMRYIPFIGQLGFAIGVGFLMFALL